MFERFGKDVKQLLMAVHGDAAIAGSTTVEGEHLLVALASAPETAGGAVLRAHGVTRGGLLSALDDRSGGFDDGDAAALFSIGIDLAQIQRSARRIFGDTAFGRAGVRPRKGGRRFGESAKTALAVSLQESLSSGSRTITTLHLLLALARDPHSRSAQLLSAHGLDYDVVRAETSPGRLAPLGPADRGGPGHTSGSAWTG